MFSQLGHAADRNMRHVSYAGVFNDAKMMTVFLLQLIY
jgi:hypothetical protein